MASFRALLLFLLSSIAVVYAHNITDILSEFPEYSQYNSFLSETKLADEINSRQTVTVLVLDNDTFSSLATKQPLPVIKKALSLLVLLDYFDDEKLHQISKGTTLTTSLYQTTGIAPGNFGFVNITNLKGGKVGFGSAAPGSKLDSTFTKSVKQIPYNISVLEISAPIIAPGILTAPPPSADVNVTALIEKAGSKTFASLIVSTGVIKTFQSAAENSLTVFAPSDEAFKAREVPDLTKLTSAEVVSLLEYHASPKYLPVGALKMSKDPISTLATNGAGKFDFSVSAAGDSVTLHTGVVSSRVASTVLDAAPLAIFTVDSVLLPAELFGKSPSPSPAPAPAPALSPSQAPAPALSPSPSQAPALGPVIAPAPAPAQGPKASSPSPVGASPPAPPAETPDDSPADAPEADDENKNAGVVVEVSAVFAVLITLMTWVILP